MINVWIKEKSQWKWENVLQILENEIKIQCMLMCLKTLIVDKRNEEIWIHSGEFENQWCGLSFQVSKTKDQKSKSKRSRRKKTINNIQEWSFLK